MDGLVTNESSNFMIRNLKSRLYETKTKKQNEIAYKIYQNRLCLSRPGNADRDWEKAGKILENPCRKLLFVWYSYLLQKAYWKFLLYWFNRQSFMSLLGTALGLVSNMSILFAAITYISSEKHRRDAEVLNAWQTLTSAHGQPGNGGRIQALEFLNSSPGANWRRKFPWFCSPMPLCIWPSESLNGIDLSSEVNEDSMSGKQFGVYLVNVVLPKASLREANLSGANLGNADLRAARLWKANLEGSFLRSSNLEGADLGGANLEGADLGAANLEGADLGGANLEGAALQTANLKSSNLPVTNLAMTDLRGANLEGADLGGANLEGADLTSTILEGANLARANLTNTNLEESKGLRKTQLEQALLCSTQFQEELNLDPNRDCEELKLDFQLQQE